MKRSVLFTLFISTHILFVVLQVHKHGSFIASTYHNQKLKARKTALTHQKLMLTQKLYACKNHTTIKAYVAQNLAMQKISLKQIKTCDAS